jgi:transposase
MEKQDLPFGKAKKRSKRDYTLDFKFELVSRIEKGEMTYNQAQRIFRIQE